MPGQEFCKYGSKCYQKNAAHLERFRHPLESCNGSDLINNVASKCSRDDAFEDEYPKSKALKLEKPVTYDVSCSSEKDSWKLMKNLDNKSLIKKLFLLSMPDDFYSFWNFCHKINRENPERALVETCDLLLVGPYDVLAGKFVNYYYDKRLDYLCHYRFYYDPPEFQTVLVTASSCRKGFHIGYFRDEPNKDPVFVASNDDKNGKIVSMGENLFSALNAYITKLSQSVNSQRSSILLQLRESVRSYVSLSVDSLFSLDPRTASMKARDKLKVSCAFHGAGIVVPYNKETQLGYREIPETPTSLKRILQKIVDAYKSDCDDETKSSKFDDLQELVTNVQFANDEGDPGMGLELGLNIFTFGGSTDATTSGDIHCFDSTIKHLLCVAYSLLHREEFATIIEAFLSRRKYGVAFNAH